MSDTEKYLGSVRLKFDAAVRITTGEFKGKPYVDIREYYLDEANGIKLLTTAKSEDEVEWKPTKKGLHLTLDSFEELMLVLSEAMAKLDIQLPPPEPVVEGEVG